MLALKGGNAYCNAALMVEVGRLQYGHRERRCSNPDAGLHTLNQDNITTGSLEGYRLSHRPFQYWWHVSCTRPPKFPGILVLLFNRRVRSNNVNGYYLSPSQVQQIFHLIYNEERVLSELGTYKPGEFRRRVLLSAEYTPGHSWC